jgi:hypothetical protein
VRIKHRKRKTYDQEKAEEGRKDQYVKAGIGEGGFI